MLLLGLSSSWPSWEQQVLLCLRTSLFPNDEHTLQIFVTGFQISGIVFCKDTSNLSPTTQVPKVAQFFQFSNIINRLLTWKNMKKAMKIRQTKFTLYIFLLFELFILNCLSSLTFASFYLFFSNRREVLLEKQSVSWWKIGNVKCAVVELQNKITFYFIKKEFPLNILFEKSIYSFVFLPVKQFSKKNHHFSKIIL